jgi:hypothetical protein
LKWHDDGEDQLTGVISTASFGSPGKMSLRFKTEDKILNKEKKKTAEKGSKKATTRSKHQTATKSLTKSANNDRAKGKKECTEKNETILEVQLRHGDVATMCDVRLQALTDVSILTAGSKS